jgi:hypothetical protein
MFFDATNNSRKLWTVGCAAHVPPWRTKVDGPILAASGNAAKKLRHVFKMSCTVYNIRHCAMHVKTRGEHHIVITTTAGHQCRHEVLPRMVSANSAYIVVIRELFLDFCCKAIEPVAFSALVVPPNKMDPTRSSKLQGCQEHKNLQAPKAAIYKVTCVQE